MLGGLGLLGLLALISKALSEVGLKILFKRVLKGLLDKGHSIEDVKETIDGYWFVSASLKIELKRYLETWGGQD